MVKLLTVGLLLVGTSISALAEQDNRYSAESLRKRLQSSEQEKLNATQRLKAAQSDPNTIRLLNKRDISYRLPDGTYVTGMLLPNGKRSPAMDINGQLVPACVSDSFALLQGNWNDSNKIVECIISDSHGKIIKLTHGGGDSLVNEVIQGSKNTVSDSNQDNSKEADQVRQSSKYNKSNKTGETTTVSGASASGHVDKASAPAQANKSGGNRSKAQRSDSNNADGLYYPPPPNRSAKSNSVVGAIARDREIFGITIGTWGSIKLNRTVSSAEQGRIEFELTETIHGRHRDLPAGTILFASKQINVANKRLEAVITDAILPDDTEIKLVARIYSIDKTAGLDGQLIRDREGELLANGSRSALTGIALAVPSLAESPVGAAVNSFSDGVISDEQRHLPRTPNAVIRVTPQTAFLKLEKTI